MELINLELRGQSRTNHLDLRIAGIRTEIGWDIGKENEKNKKILKSVKLLKIYLYISV